MRCADMEAIHQEAARARGRRQTLQLHVSVKARRGFTQRLRKHLEFLKEARVSRVAIR